MEDNKEKELQEEILKLEKELEESIKEDANQSTGLNQNTDITQDIDQELSTKQNTNKIQDVTQTQDVNEEIKEEEPSVETSEADQTIKTTQEVVQEPIEKDIDADEIDLVTGQVKDIEQEQKTEELNIPQEPSIEEVLNKINQTPNAVDQKPIAKPVIETPIVEPVIEKEPIIKESFIEEPIIEPTPIIEKPVIKTEPIIKEPVVKIKPIAEPVTEAPITETKATIEDSIVEPTPIIEPVIKTKPIIKEAPIKLEPIVENPSIEKPIIETPTIKESFVEEPTTTKFDTKINKVDSEINIKKAQNLGPKETTQKEDVKSKIIEKEGLGEENLKFLKREDITTMKKDIRKLREKGAGLESSKTLLSETKENKPKEEILTEEKNNQEQVTPKFQKKSSSSNKLFIRLAFVFIAILIGGGSYWFFNTQEKVVVETPPVQEEKVEINIPETFATIASTFTFNLEEKQKIAPAMELLSPDNLADNELTRLIIKDSEEQLVTLDKIESLFGVNFSPEILEKIDQENFNFLALKREGRIEKSIIIETTTNIGDSGLDWEKLMEEELIGTGEETEEIITSDEELEEIITPVEELEEIIAPEEETSLFKDYQAENQNVRCLINSSEYQLTLCYTTISNYFVVSESFDSIKSTIAGLNDVTRKKIGQLFIVGFEGTTITPELTTFFEKYYPGGVLLLSKNILSSQQITRLNDELQSLSLETTEQPLLISVDQEGGLVSRIEFLEELTAQSEIEESSIAYQVGLKRGDELKALGVNLNLSPLMDSVSKDDYIYDRSFQKDPEIAGELGKSLVLGQREAGIFSTIKHFPGYMGMTTNPEEKLMIKASTPVISQFEEVMKVEPKFVMTANAIYEEIDPLAPFTFSEIAIDFLKDSLGKKVLVLSDDLLQDSLLNSYTLKEIVSKPIEAGIDIEILSGYKSSVSEALDAFLEAVNNQEVSLEKIDTAVSRIIQLKEEL